MTEKSDVIIIGGGVIGCAIAYYLTKRGVRPLVLERYEIGTGGSSRNGGGVRQSARDPRELPLAMHAIQNLWPGLSDELGYDTEYHRGGNLRLGKTGEHKNILQKIVDQGTACGLELRLIDGKEAREICPYFSDEVKVASWCPTDGHGNPMKTTMAFYKRARANGARFITGEKVIEVILKKGVVAGVRTETSLYESPVVINAAGPYSRDVARMVGIDFPMQPRFVECLVTDAQPEMFGQMLGTAPSDFYGHQTKHGSFVFGGMTGLEPFEVPFREPELGPASRSITAPSMCRAIMGWFPVLGRTSIIRSWAGVIDEISDHVPVMGKVEDVPGYIFASSFCGHGYGVSPAIGQVISELVVDGEPSISLDEFRYDRFKPKC